MCANRGPRIKFRKFKNLEVQRKESVQILEWDLKIRRGYGTNLPLAVSGDGERKRRGDRIDSPRLPITHSPRLPLHLAVAALAGSFGFPVLLSQHCLARKLDLIAFAADAFHEDLLTFLQLVAHVFYATVGDFGDVQ